MLLRVPLDGGLMRRAATNAMPLTKPSLRLRTAPAFALAAAVLVAAGCASDPGPAGSLAAVWSYSGATGPANWGSLRPEYAACGSGKSQSPIDIPASVSSAPLAGLAFAYDATAGTLVDNGATLEVDFTNEENTLTVGGKAYTLVRFHFHAHSEHTFASSPAPLEMHMVHKASDGALAVVSVSFTEGAENAPLREVFAKMPTASATSTALQASIDPKALLPTDDRGWSYGGSLTTPPCTEGVSWFVYEKRVEVSKAQLAAFTSKYAQSARPVQPLNGRVVRGGTN